MVENLKYKLLIVFFGLAFLSALVLVSTPVSEVCNPDEGCSVVNHSEHAESFGIKNSIIGLVSFGFMLILIGWHLAYPANYKKNLVNYLTVFGSIFGAYFIYLQAFELGAFCKYCMTADTSILISLIIVLLKWKE